MSAQQTRTRPSVRQQQAADDDSNWIDRFSDLIAGPMINVFGLGVRAMGPLFVIGFYILLGLHVYSYFTVILTVLKKRLGIVFGMVWVAIGLVIVYNIAYNHFFATVIKPGGPADLKKIEGIRKDLKQREARKDINQAVEGSDGKVTYVEDDRFDGVSKEVKSLLKYRNKTVTQLEPNWHKMCKQCNYIKPIRAHHCSVCNRCVFLMDHHCPWVNNCLGLENLRYFLLFIFYLMIGVIYNLITIMSIWNHHVYRRNGSLMSFISILDIALCVVMIGFNGWNWYLAMTGYSTIEFFGAIQRAESGEKYDYAFKNIRDNLYKTFGTQNLIAIFSPSLRNVPFSGVEWSYQMKDLGFNERGERLAIFDDEEEEMNGQGNNDGTGNDQLIMSHEEIELTEISTSASQSHQQSRETLKSRPAKDSSLDFLDKEIEI